MKEKETTGTQMEFDEDILDPAEMYVALDLDDGSAVDCRILCIYEAFGQDYIALLPLLENGEPNPDGEVYLYRYFEDEEGEPYLENIEDDDEFDIAADAFDEIQDEELFDSMDD